MSLSYLPGTASLLEELDKKLMVLLRDGRTLIGYLRSVDQFANLVLHQTIERIHVGKSYGDIPRGVFIVRGENVVLLGEVDPNKTDPDSLGLVEVSLEEILEKQAAKKEASPDAGKSAAELGRARQAARPLRQTAPAPPSPNRHFGPSHFGASSLIPDSICAYMLVSVQLNEK